MKKTTKQLLFERMHTVGGMPLREQEENINYRNIEKIITHGGMFHADELLGIQLIKKYVKSSIPVERKFNISPEEHENPLVVVMDIGRVYEPEKSNLDHHQSSSIPASCVIAYDWIEDYAKVSIGNNNLYKFLQEVSKIDVGIISGGGSEDFFNSKIKALNQIADGLDLALRLSNHVIDNLTSGREWQDSPDAQKIIETATQKQNQIYRESLEVWDDPNKYYKGNGYAVVRDLDSKGMVQWQKIEQKRQDPIKYTLVGRGRDEKGYNVISLDSNQYPIEPNEDQIFLHPSKFMATYQTYENAIEHMKEMAN